MKKKWHAIFWTNTKKKDVFPRHETALIHYKGSSVINLGADFTSRDLVNN